MSWDWLFPFLQGRKQEYGQTELMCSSGGQDYRLSHLTPVEYHPLKSAVVNFTCIRALGGACETQVAGAKGSDATGLGWGLRMHISKKGPQAAAAGGPQTTLGESLL